MRLPTQAKPVMRNASTAKIEARFGQSAYPCSECKNKPKGEVRDLCYAHCY